MKHKQLLKAISVLVMVLSLLPWSSGPAQAAVFTVNTTDDVYDGVCNATHCSLRDAISVANFNTQPFGDFINFDIPLTDPGCDAVTEVCTIRPLSILPVLSGNKTRINGYTQPGAAMATATTPAVIKIEIDGTHAGPVSGFVITSAHNEIRGLAINRFDGYGIVIIGSGATGNVIQGNHIGTDANDTANLGNDEGGVFIASAENIIGGDTAAKRNIISDNGMYGVFIQGSNAMSNTLSGNYIGTDASGTIDLGNGWSGVGIDHGAQNNTIGGDTEGERNVISGNNMSGVNIFDPGTMNNTVSGNYIGLAANGMDALANTWYGVYIDSAPDNTIGPDNVIAHNGWDGVMVWGSSATGNTITKNSIFSHTMGIALASGANGGINAPTIMTTTVGSVNIGGQDACAGCTVEVFENSDTDGEGETYLGWATADASGHFTVTVTFLTKPYLTATATDEDDGTSEFSDVFEATVELSPPLGPVYLPIIMRNN